MAGTSTTIRAEDLIPAHQQHVTTIQRRRPGYRFREHDHRGFCEWMLILRGSLEQTVDGLPRVYQVGDLIFIGEATRHALASDSMLTFANAPVRLDVHQSLVQACGAESWWQRASGAGQPPVRRLTGRALAEAEARFRQARVEPHRPSCTARLVSCLLDLMTSTDTVTPVPEWLQQNLPTIDAGLEQGLTVADLPGLCHRSAAHIARTVRQCFGCTPSGFINRRRVTRAAELLLETRRELVDIALSLGFSSQSHFTRCFQAVHGISPGRFRRGNRDGGV